MQCRADPAWHSIRGHREEGGEELAKGRRVSGSGGSSKGSRKRASSGKSGSSRKPSREPEKKRPGGSGFVKPERDPGPKIRPSGDESGDRPILDRLADAVRDAEEEAGDSTVEEPGGHPEASGVSTGGGGSGCSVCGCCSLPLFALAAAAVAGFVWLFSALF